MKKLISLFAAISMLSISAVAVQAEEAKAMANYVPTNNAYSFEYEVGVANAGEYYGMVAVEGMGDEINTTDVSKFVYIDQATADSTGKISFSNFAPKGVAPSEEGYKVSTIFIGGKGFETAQAIGILREAGWEEKTDIIISGTAIDSVSSIKLAKITVLNAAGEVVKTAEANAEGVYSISVPAGTNYSVVITKDGYLTFTYTGVAAEADITLKEVDLTEMAGDIDGDGEIVLGDLQILLGDYNKVVGEDELESDNSDIDGDGEVVLGDLQAMLSGYNGVNVTQAYSAE